MAIILACLFSCGSKKNTPPSLKNIELTPELVFLNYTINKTSNGQRTISFINKTITDGRLKNTNHKKTGLIGDLKCTQIDKDSIEIEYIIVDNPLLKIIEYINDSLIFERKKIELNKASLSLRLQLNSKTESIVISEIIDSLQNSRPLITTKIN